ncbi:MAG TPA: 2-phospho-L-lactate guanylyltransferase [Stellaceae bacterium]|nr:2-phospho-L-lactate guanylyltransferase [Stellaceae bacterium]
MRPDRLWAVVPAKDLAQAKQRLAGVLTPEERQGLAQAMLEDVLTSLAGVLALAGTIVVTREAALAAIARSFDAHVIADLRHEGPSAAIMLAANELAAEGAAGMLAIPADVPLASAAEIGEIASVATARPAVTLVPALADMGTNAIALTPSDAIPIRFGKQSFFQHLEAALERGLTPRILRLPGIGLDIDRPEDLAAFMARRSDTRSRAFLEQRSVMDRLLDGTGTVRPSTRALTRAAQDEGD